MKKITKKENPIIFFNGVAKKTDFGGNPFGGQGFWYSCILTATEMSLATNGKYTKAGSLVKHDHSQYWKQGWYFNNNANEKIFTLNREVISVSLITKKIEATNIQNR